MVALSKIIDPSNKNYANRDQKKNREINKLSAETSSSNTFPATVIVKAPSIHVNTDNNSMASNTVALTASGKPKEKRRNNEKRKERSRDAARCRRSRETEIFTELAQVLPLKKEDVQQLDKASVMRIGIAYLKVRDMFKMFPKIQELIENLEASPDNGNTENNKNDADTSTDSSVQFSTGTLDDDESETSQSSTTTNESAGGMENYRLLLKQTLDGFLLILSNDGDITYVTDNISDYLGLSKIDIMGQQIWEYAHQCDHAELKEALNIKRNSLTGKIKDDHSREDSITTHHRDLFVRLKCTITGRGRSVNIKSASYKVIHITGHLAVNTKGDRVLLGIGRPIPHPSNIEVPLGNTTFLTKHSLDMNFTYVDDKMFNLLGYKPSDLLDTSLFNCHHGGDSDSLMTTFKNVISKGQGETCRYRFLGKYGGYCWIITQATIVYDKQKPQSVVCVNFVVSNLEKENEIYTLQQYEASQKLKTEVDSLEVINDDNKPEENIKIIKNQLKEEKHILLCDATVLITNPLEQAIAKVENTTPPPTPLNNHNNEINSNSNSNNIKSDNNNKTPQIKNSEEINEEIKNKNIIKKEQQIRQLPQITVNNNNYNKSNKTNQVKLSSNTATAATATTTAAAAALATVTATPIINSPLLPATLIVPVQQLPIALHCPTTTVTHTIFNKTVATPTFLTDDGKRPKTVTSSLISNKIPTTTSTQSIFQLNQSLNVATPRAPQSVTASVFSPLPPPKLPSTIATAAILAQQPQQLDKFSGGQQNSATTGNANHQQDMNKVYLSFAEDATELTMLKEEPDDLTAHLVATNAVDACMPLDESGPLFGEILVGFGMGSYGSLLPDDINSLDSNTSSNDHSNSNNNSNNQQTALKSPGKNTNSCSSILSAPNSPTSATYNAAAMVTATSSQSSSSLIATTTCATNNNLTTTTSTTTTSTNIDPFINYRDESNDTNCSQHLLSPSITSKSPEGSSLPSLCSPNSLSQEEEFSYYTMNVDDMDDLTMRAPYIPMNEQDDLPLLTSDDYMWSSGNAFTPDEFSLHTKDSDNLQTLQINQPLNYQQQQFTQQQTQQFSNSLCSSPASTVSSMSPSPMLQQQHHQQQQQNAQQIFSADSSELAALLCGTGNGALSILQDATNFTNSLNLNGGGSSGGANGDDGINLSRCSNTNSNNNNSNMIGSDESGVGLTDDLDSVSMASANTPAMDHQQLQQHCLQQFQEQLQHQRQQQQRHQELLSVLNINCKKEKFETANSSSPTLTPNLCDAIEDTFDHVYSKNSTNLDCWNEFLQINTNENDDTTNNAATSPQQQLQQQQGIEDCKQQLHIQLQQQQQQQEQQTQNIIINAVPLIAIQTNKNLLVRTPENNTKLLNKVNTIKLTPIKSTATEKIVENKQQQQNIKNVFMQATPAAASALHINNKRHLSAVQIANNVLETKRLKSMDLQNSTTTSQLLQQLITTPQQQQQQQQRTMNVKNCSKGLLESRWTTNENQALTQQHQQQQQQQQHKQSNSVLKNLLISGCDVSAGYCIIPTRPKPKLAKA